MNLRTSYITCFLVILEYILWANENVFQEIARKIKDTYCGAVSSSLAITSIDGKPVIVFCPNEYKNEIKIFDIHGIVIKMLYLDTEVCSLDVVKDIIVVGCRNGKIKIFCLKTGKCKKEWQAHSDGEFSASLCIC